jgi:ribose 5-phosphate isomerase A
MTQDEAKRLAAQAAIEMLPDAGVIGLGSGSTAKIFVDLVGELVKGGRKLIGVPTSDGTRRQAASLGVELLDENGPWDIALAVDGADEVSEQLDLIKGGGGCQTREKIVNYASRKNIIIVDESKLSARLGERWPVPIEVLAFAHRGTARALEAFGKVEMRLEDGKPWMTDAGNYIYDVHAGAIDDPAALDRELHALPGVVETGLFIARADVVIVAGVSGIRQLQPR